MRTVDLLLKKRNGLVLNTDEINYLISGYVNNTVTDYQMAAFCMAVFFQGMNSREIADLTLAMANSGEMIDLSYIPGIKVDKHSTGGVADTTTLILTPLVAAAGVPVAKMSGRGLGHTGGTIDKLESIPGLITSIGRDSFINQVKNINVAVVGQSENIVPADKMLYALRDVTGTVDSIPLIASSIMSKKIAAGADAIVLDVKTGRGAFMKSIEESFLLAEAMVSIGENTGRKTIAVISDMNQPLGNMIGNALEVEEAIRVLRGEVGGPLRELSITLGSHMLLLAGAAKNIEAAANMLVNTLESGQALKKFEQMIEAQGGNARVVEQINLLPQALHKYEYLSENEGYIKEIDGEGLGRAAMLLGAGRAKKNDKIDPAVGIKLQARKGEYLQKGQPLLTVYYNETQKLNAAQEVLESCYKFSDKIIEAQTLLYGVVSKNGRELL